MSEWLVKLVSDGEFIDGQAEGRVGGNCGEWEREQTIDHYIQSLPGLRPTLAWGLEGHDGAEF